MTDWQARVLDLVDASALEMTSWLQRLVRVPSVSGSDAEHEVQDLMRRELDAIGLEVDHWEIPLGELMAQDEFPGMEVDRSQAWGLVGRLRGRGDGASLMLNGHVDVVPPGPAAGWPSGDPFAGGIVGDLMAGRGTCDMKAGVAASYFAVKAVRDSGAPLRGDLILASVQGEEDGGLGTYATIRRGWRADACVIPEPTSLDLVPANAGSLTFRITVPGLAVHAARRTAGVSALDKLDPIRSALTALEARRNADVDPLTRRWDIAYPLSIGIVRGGDWASTVPDRVVADGRLGVGLDEPVADARHELEAAVAQTCAEDPWLRDHPATVEWWGGTFEPARLPAGSDLDRRMRAAHERVSSRPQATWAAPYGSDLRLMTNLAGVPTLHYGPGDVTLAHGPNESVPLAEVLTCARALAVLALDICGLDASAPDA